MVTDRTKDGLNQLVRDFFEDPSIQLTESMTADDVNGWDSLNHVSLIVAIEKKFGVSFTTKEIGSMKNIGELMELIDRKAKHVV